MKSLPGLHDLPFPFCWSLRIGFYVGGSSKKYLYAWKHKGTGVRSKIDLDEFHIGCDFQKARAIVLK